MMVDFRARIDEAERLLANEHYAQAIIAAGSLMEALLSALYNDVLPRLPPAAQQEVLEQVEAIGHGKPMTDFTLGQRVGLFRETHLFDKAQAALGRDLPHLRSANSSLFVDLRNRATHAGAEVQEDEAQLYVSQLRVFLREAGYLATPVTHHAPRSTPHALRPWPQAVHLHPDVESGETATATYAIDLGAVVAGDPNVPAVYRDARAFFRATYLTSGLRRLLQEVLGRLADAGPESDRVLQLRSPFGGGKSHVLLALYHAARDHAALAALPEAFDLADPGQVRVAVFDGEKFDAVAGKVVDGRRIHTLWGWLGWQLAQSAGDPAIFELLREHDETRGAPAGDVIAELLAGGPTLILLDEVLKYIERAYSQPVGESTLGRQAFDFLQNLSVETARIPHAVLVYSLQKSAREAMDNAHLLDILEGLTSRVDAKREPITGEEILPVLHRRLLTQKPDAGDARAVAEAYVGVVTRMRVAQAADAAARRLAEDESLKWQERVAAAYPFHPALIDLMRERWAAIPDFQRTRGALRFLAVCMHSLKQQGGAGPLLGAGDVPIADTDVRYAFFTEVGQREPFQPVLQHDFIGPNARTRRIDERLARENPALSGVRPATRLGTAILMYSFGGLPRDPSVQEGEVLPPGVTEAELLASCVGPDLDSITAQAVLKDLREHCLYLHYDGARYVFKTIPNVTQLIEDEAENVRPEETRAAIKEELERRLAGRGSIFVWPEDSQKIPDAVPAFTLVYLPLEFADLSRPKQEARAIELLSTYGDRPRRYRNALGLAAPDRNQLEPLRRAVLYLKAIERVESKKARLNLTKEQLAQLKERRGTEQTAIESGLRALYPAVWLPKSGEGGLVLDKIEAGGRPLQAVGVHERLMELLTLVPPPHLFDTVTPGRVIELLRLGEAAETGTPQRTGIATRQVRDAFFETLDFPRLADEGVIQRAIASGVREGAFGYVGQARLVRQEEGVYHVKREHVAYQRILTTDEINLDDGFILLEVEPPPVRQQVQVTPGQAVLKPGQVQQFAAVLVDPAGNVTPFEPQWSATGGTLSADGVYTAGDVEGAYEVMARVPGADLVGLANVLVGVESPPPLPPPPPPPGTVRLSMMLNRQQLYQSFTAIGNLTEKAGTVRMTVEARSLEGFDSVWLRNAVLEPLEEADIEIEKEE
ncbi:MAG TPA: DUF499 domain-containing protein [Anaerolineae bacterium]|nr:DUF499 domain-containing protein [Anaerolineae bacterium]